MASHIATTKKVYNVLLLGETGAGKSTTINAIANYLKFSTFQEAKTNEFVNLIPSKFTLPHPETGEPLEIVSGTDVNEHMGKVGKSATQSPKSYYFELDDWAIRLIDTPGIGDTEGAEIDKKNFEKILIHLNSFTHVHGICFLVKATETRTNVYFRYCITELLTHLNKSACANIVLCFTFSRNSYYGPGEGYSMLKSFLANELPNVSITLKNEINCFYIDNEAYRYLVAYKQNYPFPPNIENSYLESWNKSVEQTNKMWQQIRRVQPHNLRDTISLNNARKLILNLADPMARITRLTNENIMIMQDQKKRVESSTKDVMELAKSLKIRVKDLKPTPLSRPRTVCSNAKCIEVVKFQGVEKVNYKSKCHPECYLHSVTPNLAGKWKPKS